MTINPCRSLKVHLPEVQQKGPVYLHWLNDNTQIPTHAKLHDGLTKWLGYYIP